MRKFVYFFLGLLFITTSISAQSSETITISKEELPPELLEKLEKRQKIEDVKENIETVKEIAGDAKSIGKEIGVAVDEALGAVTKHAETFGKTDVGKFTMAMVAVSILKDQIPFVYDMIIGVLVGVPLLIFINILLYKLFIKTTRKRRILVEQNGKDKKYEYDDTWFTGSSSSEPDRVAYIVGFWCVAVIANIWITAGVIF